MGGEDGGGGTIDKGSKRRFGGRAKDGVHADGRVRPPLGRESMAWFAAVPERERVKSGKRGEEWSGKALGWTALAVADGGSAGGLGG